MKELVADEDVPRPVVEKLRDKEFSVFYIEEKMKSVVDTEVMEEARSQNLPVLTFDNDFFNFDSHPGVFHVTQRTNYDQIVKAVEDVVSSLSYEETEDSIIRINPSYYSI